MMPPVTGPPARGSALNYTSLPFPYCLLLYLLLRPHGLQSTRLLCPWNFPGKNTGAGAKSLQSCPTQCDPIDGSPPGSPVPGILQCGTRGSLRTMHGGGSAPSCCAFTHRVAFEEGSGPRCLESPRDGGAWWEAVYGVAQSRTRLKRLSTSSSSALQWLRTPETFL